jgi:hypothetical protein
VLLSKTDLLKPDDRDRMARYIQEQIHRELGLDLPVHPVSTVGPDEALLTRWFDQEIAPLWNRHRALAEASLQRKIAHLRESVIAVLQTMLTRQHGTTSPGAGGSQVQASRQLLKQADDAVQQARDRLADWCADQPALYQVMLQDAAQAVVSQAGNGSVTEIVHQVLVQRGQMAHELVTEVQPKLSQTLQSLGQAAPLVQADVAAVKNLVFRGLPVVDPASQIGELRPSPPWWASLLPGLAVRAARHAMDNRYGAALREYLHLYDRQLQSWAKSSVNQLVEAYDAQADVYREQVRRLSETGDGQEEGAGQAELLADLRALQGEGTNQLEGAGAFPK